METGKVYSTPGIDCGSDCNEKYCVGTPVTFTATAESGSKFVQWSGDCTGTDVSCTLEMNTNKNITAEFSLPSCPEYPSDGIITNATYPESKTCSCTNVTSITLGGAATVETGASVTFTAPKVTLQPGFHALGLS